MLLILSIFLTPTGHKYQPWGQKKEAASGGFLA
jgi:hypothetical protein